jgi:bacterioferritin-associated ferredoxin
LARWRKYFFPLLNVHGVNDIRQTERHTAEPLVSEPNAFEFESAIEKLKIHKSPVIDQIPTQQIKAGVEQFAMRSINLLSLFGIRRNCLRCGRSRSLYLTLRRAIRQIVVIIGAYHSCQLLTKFYSTSCS